jgi:hypothetical protein
MPREIVALCVDDVPAVELFAELMAHIVWPEKADLAKRSEFQRSLCFWAIRRRSALDKEWARRPTDIRPVTIIGRTNSAKQFAKNFEQMRRQMICARLVVHPFLPKKARSTLAGLQPRI